MRHNTAWHDTTRRGTTRDTVPLRPRRPPPRSPGAWRRVLILSFARLLGLASFFFWFSVCYSWPCQVQDPVRFWITVGQGLTAQLISHPCSEGLFFCTPHWSRTRHGVTSVVSRETSPHQANANITCDAPVTWSKFLASTAGGKYSALLFAYTVRYAQEVMSGGGH